MTKYTTLPLAAAAVLLLAGCTMMPDKTPANDDMNMPADAMTNDDGMMNDDTMTNDDNMMPQETMDNGAMMNDSVMVGGAAMLRSNDIIANVSQASNLTTLVAAVKAAGLVETLQGPGPFTVFGPDNMAFDKLPTGTVDTLLKPENKDMLAKILTYHVVSGTYTAADLTDGKVLTTVQGQMLTVKVQNGKVMLMSDTNNVATVTMADIYQSNGIAHVIDTVLMPK